MTISSQTDVIIIGAGAAGLSAARELNAFITQSDPATTQLVFPISRSSTAGFSAEVSAEVPSLRDRPGRQVQSFPGQIEAVSRGRAHHPP